MIATRYVVREIFHTKLLILSILLALLVLNMFIHYLGVAAAGAMIGADVAKLIGMTLPRYLAQMIPVAYYLAIIFSAGKLFQDNELTVLFACGMSWRQLLKMAMMPGVFLALVVGVISLIVMPKMSVYLGQLTTKAATKNNLQFIQPGRFVSLSDNQGVVYIGKSNLASLQVEDMFFYRLLKDGTKQIVIAPFGYQKTDYQTGQTYITLQNGRAYTVPQKGKRYQLIRFKDYQIQLKSPSFRAGGSLDESSTLRLLQTQKQGAQAELQWRLSMPISVVVLTLMGLAICYVRPRQSRFIKIIPAVLLFMMYFNLIAISKNWLADGVLPAWIGLWWVHILFGGGALLSLMHKDGLYLLEKLRKWIKRGA